MSRLIKNFSKNFSIIDNRVLQCQELDLNAKGLYVYIASLPDDWSFSIERVARANKTTEGKVKNAIEQLESVGLLKREYSLNADGKRGYRADYTIFDFDTKTSEVKNSIPQKLGIEKEGVAYNNITKKESYKESISQNNNLKNKENASFEAILTDSGTKRKKEYPAEFEAFWKEYPNDADKSCAFQAFKKALKLTDLQTLISKAREYRESCIREKREKAYIRHASTWLNKQSWENDYTGAEQKRGSVFERDVFGEDF